MNHAVARNDRNTSAGWEDRLRDFYSCAPMRDQLGAMRWPTLTRYGSEVQDFSFLLTQGLPHLTTTTTAFVRVPVTPWPSFIALPVLKFLHLAPKGAAYLMAEIVVQIVRFLG